MRSALLFKAPPTPSGAPFPYEDSKKFQVISLKSLWKGLVDRRKKEVLFLPVLCYGTITEDVHG